MFGQKIDYEVLMKAVKKGEVTRENLLEAASRVYNTIELLNQ